MTCRHCHAPLDSTFANLAFAPPSNAYLTKSDLLCAETYYPLDIRVCTNCWLVQTIDYTQASDLFTNSYAYFSSTSSTWLQHAESYVGMIVERLSLNNTCFVIEVASNDGYLLKNFQELEIPCLGIEPTLSTASLSQENYNLSVITEFFGQSLASRLASNNQTADLIIGNNVFAHVPNINDFTAGLRTVLKPNGVITLEFPHLLQLLIHTQFDTIYHEHFSYLSLYTAREVLKKHGLRIFDVDELETHGGSLRIYACHDNDPRPTNDSVYSLLNRESVYGLQTLIAYSSFQTKVEEIKHKLLRFLLELKFSGKTVAAYGAAAKGNTLLNFSGISTDLIPYVCDASPAKQGLYLPGSHLPIKHPEYLINDQPDYLLILPWNLSLEIISQLRPILPETKFFTAVPSLKILS